MNKKLKLIFMGTPEFAVPILNTLFRARFDIVAVYSQPPRPAGRGQKEKPSPVQQYAVSHGIHVHTPVTLKGVEAQHIFREHKADITVVAAYGLLLPKPILESTRLGCINVHPSLLPRWRGAAPIQRTIMAGDKETGVIIMQMDAGLDTGDMLLTKHFSIPDGMNAGQLHDTLAETGAALLIDTLNAIQNNQIKPVKQSEEGVTYAHKITKEECRIDWNLPAHVIRNKILGLAPQPGAYFIYRDEAIKIFSASITSQQAPPGTVLDDKLTIACSEGALTDLVLRRPGKTTMPATEMLKGYKIAKGDSVA